MQFVDGVLDDVQTNTYANRQIAKLRSLSNCLGAMRITLGMPLEVAFNFLHNVEQSPTKR